MSFVHLIKNKPALRGLPTPLRPVLRPAGTVSAAFALAPRGHAGADCAAPRPPQQSRCFTGPEGLGCALSMAEVTVLARVWTEPMSWEAVA
jgi:hypothetical protein